MIDKKDLFGILRSEYALPIEGMKDLPLKRFSKFGFHDVPLDDALEIPEIKGMMDNGFILGYDEGRVYNGVDIEIH